MCKNTEYILDIDIRPFERDHQREVRNLILTGMGERWGSIDESANPDIDDIENSYGSNNFFVGFHDGELAATGGLVPESDSRVRVTRMWVAKHLRRAGIGSQMMRHLLTIVRQRQFKHVVLETTDTWQDAISFYKKHGFLVQDHRDGDIHFSMDLSRDT